MANLRGARKRPDGLWEYRERVNGNRISIYAATESELRKKLADERARGDGELRPRNPITVGQCFDEWLALVEKNRKRTTYALYETMYRLYIKPALATKKLDKIDSTDIEHLYRSLDDKGVGTATIRRVHLVLQRALGIALRKRTITVDPLSGVEPPRHITAKMQTLDREQIDRLITAIKGDRYEALYLLAAVGGMRQGELFALRWSAIDFCRGILTIEQSLQDVNGKLSIETPKTKTSIRSLDFGLGIARALKRRQKDWLSEGHDSPYVFTTPTGEFLRKSNFIRRDFAAVIKKAKLPAIRFHDLRHTAATMMLMAEIHPKVAAERLGHASVRTTLDRYSHVVKGMGRDASDTLEAFIFKAGGGKNGGSNSKRGTSKSTPRKRKSP